MRTRVLILSVLLAASCFTFARKEETLEQLVARAESTPLPDQPGIYTGIAARQVQLVDTLYTVGRVAEAAAAVADVVTYSERASDAAIKSGNKLKHTEISLRKMAAKLRDIKRGVNFEDQAPVQAAIDRLEQLRTLLLARMFEKEKK